MTTNYPSHPKWQTLNWQVWASLILGILGLSVGLAWISSGFGGVTGWVSFFIAILLAAGILLAGWWALRAEKPPQWLGALLVGAALLRLAAGVFWFVAMPQLGHGTPTEQAGYITADAGARDQFAWKLSQSKKSLLTAFQGQRRVDQYGGLLFLSAAVYRYLGSDYHQPLLMVVFTSAISALVVLFTWALAQRAWDSQVARLAAWVMALYPEAILLGSSQMREAFSMTFVVISFYDLLRYQQERT